MLGSACDLHGLLDASIRFYISRSMKNPVLGLWLLSLVSVSADSMDALKTRSGREYAKVEIVSHDDVGVKIRHEAGSARIAFTDLPDELQKKYSFDPKKAAAQKAREAAQMDALPEGPAAPIPAADGPSAAPPPAPGFSEETMEDPKDLAAEDSSVKMAVLVAGLTEKIKQAQDEIKSLTKEAMMERMKTRMVDDVPDRNGRVYSKQVPDKRGKAKAKRIDGKIADIQGTINRAKVIIQKAKARYKELTGEVLVTDDEEP